MAMRFQIITGYTDNFIKAEVLWPIFYGRISSYFVVSFPGMRYLSTPLTFYAVNIHWGEMAFSTLTLSLMGKEKKSFIFV